MLAPIVNIYKLGRIPYLKALDIQRVLFNRLKESKINSNHVSNEYEPSNSLLLVEHHPVYTIGLRTESYDDNYVNSLRRELELNNLKADFVKTNRGGLVTYHGPGQLVAYPILYLGDFMKSLGGKKSLRAYVKALENTIIDTLSHIGIPGAHTIREYPGVWLDGGQRKIAFIGIHSNHNVTMHGISINCDCDLAWFDHIVSCGIKDRAITSIKKELSLSSRANQAGSISNVKNMSTTRTLNNDNITNPSSHNASSVDNSLMDNVTEAFCKSFGNHFECNLLKPLTNNW